MKKKSTKSKKKLIKKPSKKVIIQKADSAVAKLCERLKSLFPFPPLSTKFLAQAINQGAKVFLTSDPLIMQQQASIEKDFGIYITDNYSEASDIAAHGRRRTSVELLEESNNG